YKPEHRPTHISAAIMTTVTSAEPAQATRMSVIEDLREELATLPLTSRFTDADLEAIYALGHKLFVQGKYEKAGDYFSLLTVYRPLEERYLLALGVCMRLRKRYAEAIEAFAMAATLQPE